MSIKVEVHLLDGGYQDWIEPASYLARYHALAADGFEGKALIHELISDDWGAPPIVVKLTGEDTGGQPVDITIPYR